MLTRDQILEAVWDSTFAGNASVLETYISYLRHKIDADGEVPLIHTVRGVGSTMRLPAGMEGASAGRWDITPGTGYRLGTEPH